MLGYDPVPGLEFHCLFTSESWPNTGAFWRFGHSRLSEAMSVLSDGHERHNTAFQIAPAGIEKKL
jgi:hypothetical protein